MTYVSSIIQGKTTVVVELIVSHIAPNMSVENSFLNKPEKRVVMKTIRIVHISDGKRKRRIKMVLLQQWNLLRIQIKFL